MKLMHPVRNEADRGRSVTNNFLNHLPDGKARDATLCPLVLSAFRHRLVFGHNFGGNQTTARRAGT
eukprot:scaffold52609_cov47-Prasinocladus_malaysianus.AAC.3